MVGSKGAQRFRCRAREAVLWALARGGSKAGDVVPGRLLGATGEHLYSILQVTLTGELLSLVGAAQVSGELDPASMFDQLAAPAWFRDVLDAKLMAATGDRKYIMDFQPKSNHGYNIT